MLGVLGVFFELTGLLRCLLMMMLMLMMLMLVMVMVMGGRGGRVFNPRHAAKLAPSLTDRLWIHGCIPSHAVAQLNLVRPQLDKLEAPTEV